MKPEPLNKEDAKRILIRESKSGKKYKTYVFECSLCGTDINLQTNKMNKGPGKCIRCAQKGRPYEHILKELIHTCKKRNKHEVTISYEDFLNLIEKGKCHYCTKNLIFYPHTRDSLGEYTSRAYQLDRKDNNLGYTLDNSVPCCWECNRLKSDIYTYEEFMKIAVALKKVQKARK